MSFQRRGAEHEAVSISPFFLVTGTCPTRGSGKEFMSAVCSPSVGKGLVDSPFLIPHQLWHGINEYSRKLLKGNSTLRIREESISGESHSFIFYLASPFGLCRQRRHQFQRFAGLSETHVWKERITFTFALWLYSITIAGEIPQSALRKGDCSLLYFFPWTFFFPPFSRQPICIWIFIFDCGFRIVSNLCDRWPFGL